MKNIIIISILYSFAISSCKKTKDRGCPEFRGLQVPNSLFFVIKQGGQRLTDASLNNLKLYYFNSGQKIYIDDFQRAINEGNLNAFDLGIMATRNIGLKSGTDNIKDYFLEFQNGDIDTLFVDYKRYSQCEADTSGCQCIFPRFGVKYNGQTSSYDPTISQQTVYLFNKL